jgi:hypothetical protein
MQNREMELYYITFIIRRHPHPNAESDKWDSLHHNFLEASCIDKYVVTVFRTFFIYPSRCDFKTIAQNITEKLRPTWKKLSSIGKQGVTSEKLFKSYDLGKNCSAFPGVSDSVS